MTSQEYKTLVSRYAILAIRNQLNTNQSFYKEAIKAYDSISDYSDLECNNTFTLSESLAGNYKGAYIYVPCNDYVYSIPKK
ncbi:MAG: hypothetical protein ACI8YQ_001014 [Polaribacter sp.]|jgi:hypothetical protein